MAQRRRGHNNKGPAAAHERRRPGAPGSSPFSSSSSGGGGRYMSYMYRGRARCQPQRQNQEMRPPPPAPAAGQGLLLGCDARAAHHGSLVGIVSGSLSGCVVVVGGCVTNERAMIKNSYLLVQPRKQLPLVPPHPYRQACVSQHRRSKVERGRVHSCRITAAGLQKIKQRVNNWGGGKKFNRRNAWATQTMKKKTTGGAKCAHIVNSTRWTHSTFYAFFGLRSSKTTC
jgi:hypothetical protein